MPIVLAAVNQAARNDAIGEDLRIGVDIAEKEIQSGDAQAVRKA